MKEKLFAGGGVLAAVLASSCCIGPLILAAIGMSGAGFAAPVEKYRPVFTGITFAMIGAAYYFTYGRRKKACCEGESKRGRRIKEITLWTITVIAVGLAAFPYAWGRFAGGGVEEVVFQDDMKVVTLEVEGMTCAGCASTIKSALSGVRGVRAVRINLKNGTAAIGIGKDMASEAELLTVLKKTGYKGRLMGERLPSILLRKGE